jgi:hypothetical protein
VFVASETLIIGKDNKVPSGAYIVRDPTTGIEYQHEDLLPSGVYVHPKTGVVYGGEAALKAYAEYKAASAVPANEDSQAESPYKWHDQFGIVYTHEDRSQSTVFVNPDTGAVSAGAVALEEAAKYRASLVTEAAPVMGDVAMDAEVIVLELPQVDLDQQLIAAHS